jgi:hypothetical protein
MLRMWPLPNFVNNGTVNKDQLWNFVILKRQPTPWRFIKAFLFRSLCRSIKTPKNCYQLLWVWKFAWNCSFVTQLDRTITFCNEWQWLLQPSSPPPSITFFKLEVTTLLGNSSLYKAASFFCKFLFAFFQTNFHIAQCYLSCRIANVMFMVRHANCTHYCIYSNFVYNHINCLMIRKRWFKHLTT